MRENLSLFLALLLGVLTGTVILFLTNHASIPTTHLHLQHSGRDAETTSTSIVTRRLKEHKHTHLDTNLPQNELQQLEHHHQHQHHHSHHAKNKTRTRIAVIIPTHLANTLRRRYINLQFARENWPESEVRIFWVFGNKLSNTQLTAGHSESSNQQDKDNRQQKKRNMNSNNNHNKKNKEEIKEPVLNEFDPTTVYQETRMSRESVIFTPCLDLEEPEVKVYHQWIRGKQITKTITTDRAVNSNATSTVPLSPATTCKLYWAMKHLHHHFEADYLIRSSDTAYLNIRKFLEIEPALPKNSSIWLGRQMDEFHLTPASLEPFCDKKIQTLFGVSHLTTNYLSGMGYVLSWDIVTLIGNWNIQPHLLTPDIGNGGNDDVMLGMYLMTFQVQRINQPDLFIFRPASIANPELQSSYGQHDVILVQFVETRDWAKIDDNGRISISKPPRMIVARGNR